MPELGLMKIRTEFKSHLRVSTTSKNQNVDPHAGRSGGCVLNERGEISRNKKSQPVTAGFF